MDPPPMDVMSLNLSRVSLLFADVSIHHVLRDLHASVSGVFDVWVLVVPALFCQRGYRELCCILCISQLERFSI